MAALRSALDHAVFALSSSRGDEPPAGSEFPIFLEDRKFRATTRPGGLWKIRAVPTEAQRVIESVQPFHQGDGEPERHPLWVLHQLNNADKHRTLNLIGAAVGLSGLRLEADGGVEIVRSSLRADGAVREGDELARWSVRATHRGKVQMQGEIGYTVAFDVNGPAMGEPVRSSFHMLGNGVKSIVAMLTDSTAQAKG
jgi:hypothetical protein